MTNDRHLFAALHNVAVLTSTSVVGVVIVDISSGSIKSDNLNDNHYTKLSSLKVH